MFRNHYPEHHTTYIDFQRCHACNPYNAAAYQRGCNANSLTRRIAMMRTRIIDRMHDEPNMTAEAFAIVEPGNDAAWYGETITGIGTQAYWNKRNDEARRYEKRYSGLPMV